MKIAMNMLYLCWLVNTIANLPDTFWTGVLERRREEDEAFRANFRQRKEQMERQREQWKKRSIPFVFAPIVPDLPRHLHVTSRFRSTSSVPSHRLPIFRLTTLCAKMLCAMPRRGWLTKFSTILFGGIIAK